MNRLADNIAKVLKQLWEDIKLLISLLKDYYKGDYRDIPFKSIALIAAAILYFIAPIDAIPDFIPVFGYIVDASVITLCLKAVHDDLQGYKDWRAK